ncbi:MAG TPA: Tim44 domain-containing protein, partial [Syntrophales bacterium]|nr:Tim44 domain-containing protein [Syntrophales bacterium]
DPQFNEDNFQTLCMDIFFKIQGAWANRDMASARSLLTDEMFRILQSEAEQMQRDKKFNKLENIAVRNVEIAEAWQEEGRDYITVRFLANLLDYTVSERGELLDGSKTDPVKFEEYWTFVRPVGNNPWQLSGIDQGR